MVKMGSPSKDLDALKHSHKLLNSVKQNPIILLSQLRIGNSNNVVMG